MLNKITILTTLLALPSHAASVAWDGGGADNYWDTADNWDDNSAPSAADDYIVDGATIQSPDSGPTSFGGNSLTVQNSGVLNLYRTNGGGYFNVDHSINNLTIINSEIRPESSNGSIAHTLLGNLNLSGANTINMKERSNYTMRFFHRWSSHGIGLALATA